MIETGTAELSRIKERLAIPADEVALITLVASTVLTDKEGLAACYGSGEREKHLSLFYQALLFLPSFTGWPTVIQALAALVKGKPSSREDVSERESYQLGCSVFKQVHGSNAETVELMMKGASSRLYDEIITEVYGKKYTTCSLSHRQKELVAVAALAMLDRQQQLKSHIISALNAGMDATEIEDVFMLLSWFSGWPLAINAVRSLAQVRGVMKLKNT